MAELKPREQQVLDYIKESLCSEGYAPTVRDICSKLNFKSTSTVQMYIDRLIKMGYLVRENGKSRTLRIDEPDSENQYRVPIIGQVAAGQPILATQSFDGYVTYSTRKKYDKHNLFALKVKGESMIKAGILDGDVVIVDRRSYCENSEIVVAMIDDETTVKRFYKEEGRYRLQPENDSMEPIYTDSVTVLGKVVALMRSY